VSETAGRKLRLGFVTPRYGEEVVGGSESVMAEAARALALKGHGVEILTTCARSHVSWDNEYPAGTFVDEGVLIRRFPAVTGGARLVVAHLERRVQRGEQLEPLEEVAWVNGRFRVPKLYIHLLREAAFYDALIFSPYLFWTTVYGTSAAPTKAIVMPCLHDESYARLAVIAATLGSASGLWFLSEPEQALARQIIPGLPEHQDVVGAAVEVPDSYDPDGFRARHKLTKPFVLYAGRREEGKGWGTLLNDFGTVLRTDDPGLDLVTVGSGVPRIPPELAGRVHDLGFLDPEDLPSAFAAASALIQPSANESFSRTTMEAFLARTPVIATVAGEVVAWHLRRSGGGETYVDGHELSVQLRHLVDDWAAAAALGERGRAYVLEHYTWDRVASAMEESLFAFTSTRR
jgi:glycosyltransferase involved in cell wall biosynthesis